jgi:hypothetical protein
MGPQSRPGCCGGEKNLLILPGIEFQFLGQQSRRCTRWAIPVPNKPVPFWILTPCSSEKVWCFGGTYRLHHQGWRVSQKSASGKSGQIQASPSPKGAVREAMEEWQLSARELTANGIKGNSSSVSTKPHGVTIQKIVLFTVTAVRTSDPNFRAVLLP